MAILGDNVPSGWLSHIDTTHCRTCGQSLRLGRNLGVCAACNPGARPNYSSPLDEVMGDTFLANEEQERIDNERREARRARNLVS